MRERSWWTPYLFLLPALIGLGTFQIAPIVVSFVGSLQTTTLRGETVFAGFANYFALFTNPIFWESLRVTAVFNLIINPLQVVLALLLALLVFRPTPGVSLFRTFFFLPVTISIAVTAILWGLLLDPNLGLVNGVLRTLGLDTQPFFRSASQALGSFIALATWRGVGYWMIFVLAGLYAIPVDVYEAARIDGASSLRSFFSITLPLLKRPLAFVLVADTALNFLFFAPVYIITSGGPLGATNLLMFEAYKTAFVYLDFGRSLALSSVILFIIGIIAAFELRLFRTEVEY
jgi:multiple sugar transport system permease protein